MQKRKFRSRPSRANSSNVKYTFHSYGSVFSFDPYRIIEDDRRTNEAGWFDKIRQLDMYKDEVRMANVAHVYIMDEKGNQVAP